MIGVSYRNAFRLLTGVFAACCIATASLSAAQAQESTLDKVKARGVLNAGVRSDAPPFGYIDENGHHVGFEVDTVKYIGQKLGVKVNLITVTSATRIPLLQSGQIDLAAAAMNITREREKAIDFSVPHVVVSGKILVKKGSGIQGLDDLKGKKIAFLQGSPSTAMERVKASTGSEIVTLPDTTQAAQAVLQGKVAALIMDSAPLYVLAKNNPGKFEVVGEVWPAAPEGIGMRQNDSEWRDAVNFALIDMWNDGTYKKIYTQYFGVDPDPSFIIYPWQI
ncbi:transporter substrate-binding domain-containing protein [Affinibrenneria salicis]|uniref:Transporter substrate-binding domain-containing protein n=1 Tax=Affinibrenneria salicis TaxID=2590031 RepID=A0A5J5G1Y9_9GAMM|nr:transporter substrate-binding domain-containing protein [Affinibrenneria salicis]KAA9000681.1 transporter substrate-binding domain-containing protein [Affinibrenneria salicis]